MTRRVSDGRSRGSCLRIEVMHGVNLDRLGERDPRHYGRLTLRELERRLAAAGRKLGIELSFFQTNHEGEFVERLHSLQGTTDAVVLNPGAWTHYSYAIRDALEIAGLLAVEVHLSDVDEREAWRRRSTIRELCELRIAGKGCGGYIEAFTHLRRVLGG